MPGVSMEDWEALVATQQRQEAQIRVIAAGQPAGYSISNTIAFA